MIETVKPLMDLPQIFIHTDICVDKTMYQILFTSQFKFVTYCIHINIDIYSNKLPMDKFCPRFDRILQTIC